MPRGRLSLIVSGLPCVSALLYVSSAAAQVTPSSAASTTSLRVLVICQNAPECQRRVAGQLADLDGVRQDAAAYDSSTKQRHLSNAAVAHDVVAVLLAETGMGNDQDVAGAHSVIRFRDSPELYQRKLGPPMAGASPRDNSATLEMFALGVRSAVKSLLLERAQREPEPAAEPAPAPDDSHDVHEISKQVGFVSHVGAGARLSTASTVSPLIELGGGITTRFADAWIAVRWIPTTQVDVGETRAHLKHAEAGLLGATTLVRSGLWDGRVLVGAWIAWSRRSTSTSSGELTPTPDARSLTAAASLDLAVRRQLTSDQHLALRLGADWFPSSTRFAVASTAGDQEIDAVPLWSVRPRAALSWQLRW